MRRLRLTNRMLSLLLLAAVVQVIASGPRFGVLLVGIVVGLLLLASLALTRRGRRDLPNLEQIEAERLDLAQDPEQR